MSKCVYCGYLSARNETTRKLEEVEERCRLDGNLGQGKYVHIPICFVRSFNITKEVITLREKDEKRRDTVEWHKYVKEFINQERDCNLFTDWQQGFEPKEHREMLDNKAMIKWQQEQRQFDLQWQENQRKEDRRWHIIELIVFGVISVLVAGGFTIFGAFISRGVGG